MVCCAVARERHADRTIEHVRSSVTTQPAATRPLPRCRARSRLAAATHTHTHTHTPPPALSLPLPLPLLPPLLQDYDSRGFYTWEHPTIRFFWDVMASFSPEQKRNFVRCVAWVADGRVRTSACVRTA